MPNLSKSALVLTSASQDLDNSVFSKIRSLKYFEQIAIMHAKQSELRTVVKASFQAKQNN